MGVFSKKPPETLVGCAVDVGIVDPRVIAIEWLHDLGYSDDGIQRMLDEIAEGRDTDRNPFAYASGLANGVLIRVITRTFSRQVSASTLSEAQRRCELDGLDGFVTVIRHSQGDRGLVIFAKTAQDHFAEKRDGYVDMVRKDMDPLPTYP